MDNQRILLMILWACRLFPLWKSLHWVAWLFGPNLIYFDSIGLFHHKITIILSSSSVIPSFHINLLKSYDLNFKSNSPSNPNFSFVHCNIPQGLPSFNININPILKKTLASTLRFIARECMNSNDVLFGEDGSITYDWKDKQGENEDMGSPWEGAVVYQRNPSISHVEYCTTLERLGLGKLSTEVSRSRASVMGLRVTRAVKDFPLGTPVLISVDVTRKKKKLRLDGIVRTVITLACNRYLTISNPPSLFSSMCFCNIWLGSSY